ncbi:rhamnulokinase [Kibdelosporangium phytohabitans]|uniref:Carbohydrate kinase n=1 Tax=Kibdelosporangium phytohabitans TaxID=860235 RepID=A0A0N9HZQ8_9PSEU|nr:rhamnulokinase family protein [Kibdelosporangium phytohabitans]ALG09043.1 carbohydrate kinase [Kibdelosporangium phytohabitans]MBE1469771.1 rhamnulokinase [Kibdelosporangium phytohabitans]
MFAAVDLGASSGRVMLGTVDGGEISLTELTRFATGPRERPGGGLRWDVGQIRDSVLAGLRLAGTPVSIGIDSWAVDYGLLDSTGTLDGDVRCYRDPRVDGVAERVSAVLPELYAITGIQHLPFNTIYQLMTEPPERLAGHTMLLLPDLIGYWLTGTIGAEVTNASTTGLLDATTRKWSPAIVSRLGFPESLLPALRQPGEHVGTFESSSVVSVASHDTASAVAAVPFASPRSAYISCGTWSLVGVQLDAPVLTPDARAANFTNESGVDGSVRFLRNTMGLWLLNECLRVWDVPLPPLLAAATRAPAFAAVVDPDDPSFFAPGDMPARIAAYCARTGQPEPPTRAAMVRTILESLALAHARTLRTAARLAGHDIDFIHLVGGGARNSLLCQLTADASGIAVLAGPVEASALGNVLVQARAAGVHASPPPAFASYQPCRSRTSWQSAADRIGL